MTHKRFLQAHDRRARYAICAEYASRIVPRTFHGLLPLAPALGVGVHFAVCESKPPGMHGGTGLEQLVARGGTDCTGGRKPGRKGRSKALKLAGITFGMARKKPPTGRALGSTAFGAGRTSSATGRVLSLATGCDSLVGWLHADALALATAGSEDSELELDEELLELVRRFLFSGRTGTCPWLQAGSAGLVDVGASLTKVQLLPAGLSDSSDSISLAADATDA